MLLEEPTTTSRFPTHCHAKTLASTLLIQHQLLAEFEKTKISGSRSHLRSAFVESEHYSRSKSKLKLLIVEYSEEQEL